MKKLLCLAQVLCMLFANTLAFLISAERWRQVPKEDLYDTDEAELPGHICWTPENGPVHAPVSLLYRMCALPE